MRASGAMRTTGAARRAVGAGLLVVVLLGGCSDDDSGADAGPRGDGSDTTTSTTTSFVPASEQIGDETSTATFEIPPALAQQEPKFPAVAYVPAELEIELIEPVELYGVLMEDSWSIEGRMPGGLEDVYDQVEAAYAPTLPVAKDVSGRTFRTEDHLVMYMAFRDGDAPTVLSISLLPLDATLPPGP